MYFTGILETFIMKDHSGSTYVVVVRLTLSSGARSCQNGSSITIKNCSCFHCFVCRMDGFCML